MAVNLNVTPYYDDYAESKDFHRILFRPGRAIQARELTQLQTILQRQVQRHGDHIFKEGSMIVPGHVHYDPLAEYITVQATHNSVAVTHTNFLNRTIRGRTSGVVGKVINTLAAEGSDPITLYVKYENELAGQTLTLTGGSGTYTVAEKVTGGTSGAIGYVTSWNSGTGALVVRGVSKNGFSASETVTGQTSSAAKTISSLTALATSVRFTDGEIIGTVQTLTGSASSGNFIVGEKVSGNASSATGTVVAWNSTTKELSVDYTTGTFTTADTVTGASSSATLTMSSGTITGTNYGATASTSSATGTGSTASIDDGIYYVYGNFIRSSSETIILDKYTNTPSYRVGLSITESFVSSTDDGTLTDNATGTPNYAAPGADRYKITAALSKVTLTSTSDQNFIEVMRLNAGALQEKVRKTEYSILAESLARRTHDESGDYTVRPYDAEVKEHLDTGSNRGVYTASNGGLEPKLAVAMGPGKAYVRGYEVENIATQFVTVDKGRSTKSVNNATTAFQMGNYVEVNNCYNLPEIDDHVSVALYNTATSTRGSASGSAIGSAKVRAIEHKSGTPSGTGAAAVFKLYLFDIAMTGSNTFEVVKQIYMAGSPAFTCDTIATATSLTGTVSTASSSTTVTGVGTKFTTELAAGQFVKIVGVTEGKIASITSDTVLVLSANASAVVAGQVMTRQKSLMVDDDKTISIFRLPDDPIKTVRDTSGNVDTTYAIRRQFTGTSDGSGNITINAGSGETFSTYSLANWSLTYTGGGSVGNIVNIASGITLGGSPTGSTATIATGANSTAVKIIATLTKGTATEKTKTLSSSTSLHIASPNTTVNSYDSLGKADIYALTAVYDSGATGTNATTSDTNITSSYELDTGQRDTHYGIGRLRLLPGARAPVGRILIVFTYFTHGAGDYFSVNSYSGISYGDILAYTSSASGTKYELRNCLDFRPRMRDAGDNTTTGASAFSGTGASTIEYVQIGSNVRTDYDFYLPRIDKLFINIAGDFGIRSGIAAVNPTVPAEPDDALVLYHLRVPAYTFSPDDVEVVFQENKRYTMRDIGKLETRIDNMEYYTSLNLLEKETADLQIQDSAGLDRFKNGFIVDPFLGHNIGDVLSSDYQCSVDMEDGELRPQFVQDNVELTLTTGSSSDYQKTGDIITLPFTHEALITQPYASRTESVNPFNISTWIGSIALDPPGDEWRDVDRRPALVINNDGNFDVMNALAATQNFGGTVWNDWQTTWTGVRNDGITTRRQKVWRRQGHATWAWADVTAAVTSSVTQQTRTGIRTRLVSNTVRQSLGDRILNVAFVRWIRARNVAFTGKRFKPHTRLYPFFDSVAVTAECTPTGGAAGDALVTNGNGEVTGTFAIPNTTTKRFRTGDRVFRLTSSSSDARDATVTTAGEEEYTARGLLETRQESILSTRRLRIQRETVTQTRNTSTQNFRVLSTRVAINWRDPLAETIMIDTPGGVFLTKLDLFFGAKADHVPVSIQIRTTDTGYPGNSILPFSEVTLNPNDVNISSTAATATTFTFESPVYLEENTEYAIIVMSDDNAYTLWHARVGEVDVGTTRTISEQPYMGVMFKSQNSSTWTASQIDDLKFTLYRAKFDITKTSTIVFNNGTSWATAKSLVANPFKTTNASTTVVVSHPNHMMPDTPASKVTIAGAAAVNGVTAAMLNTTHNVVNADIDSYEIVVSGNANATGHGGAAAATATFNRQVDVVQPIVSELVFPKTSTSWSHKATTGRSIHGTETAYTLDSAYTAIELNDNNYYDYPRMVCSPINETNNLSGNKSFWLKGLLTSTSDNVSPVIDTQRMSLSVVNNRLDTPTSSGTTQVRDFVVETAALGSSSSAKYLTRKVTLDSDSTALKAFITAVRPSTATIEVYYRVSTVDSNTPFTDVAWTLLTADNTPIASEHRDDWKEYKYSVSSLSPFNVFAIKIVMKGTNTADPPRLTDLRAIALAV